MVGNILVKSLYCLQYHAVPRVLLMVDIRSYRQKADRGQVQHVHAYPVLEVAGKPVQVKTAFGYQRLSGEEASP